MLPMAAMAPSGSRPRSRERSAEPVAAPLGERQHQRRHLPAMPARIDAQVDEVEHHAGQRPVEIVEHVDPHAEAAGRGSLAGHERQRIGAAFEIGERELVRLSRIGMVDPLRHAPAAGLLARNRRGSFRLRIERLDLDAVMGAGDELLLEIRALQHALDELEPLLAGGLREIGGEREIVHCRHQANSMMVASTARLSPSLAWILEMVPSRSARSTFSIFMASTMQSGSPALTSCPTETLIAFTSPGIGHRSCLPVSASSRSGIRAASSASRLV